MSAEYKPVAFALFRDGDIDWDDDECFTDEDMGTFDPEQEIRALYDETAVKALEAEIEALKLDGEPVAWMYQVNDTHTLFDTAKPPDDAYDKDTLTPLYDHSAKTLTDEEKFDICINCNVDGNDPQIWNLIEKILNKASEK